MASVCGRLMALTDAGVPISHPAAGVAIRLVTKPVSAADASAARSEGSEREKLNLLKQKFHTVALGRGGARGDRATPLRRLFPLATTTHCSFCAVREGARGVRGVAAGSRAVGERIGEMYMCFSTCVRPCRDLPSSRQQAVYVRHRRDAE